MSRAKREGRDTIIYFAYGSNMLESPMKSRTPSAVALGIGKLKDMKVLMNKRSTDGSGKANLIDSPGDIVCGVLYEFDASEMPNLDRAEAGYDRHSVEVALDENIVEAIVYISRDLTDEPVAYDWYRDIIIEGAREHGPPEDYIEYLRSMPHKPDIGRGT